MHAIQVCWELTKRNEKRELDGVADALKSLDLVSGMILTYTQEELDKVIEDVKAAGMDPEQAPKIKELRSRLTEKAVDIVALKNGETLKQGPGSIAKNLYGPVHLFQRSVLPLQNGPSLAEGQDLAKPGYNGYAAEKSAGSKIKTRDFRSLS